MTPNMIQLPFALANEPRLYLAWLGNFSTLPENQKAEIREWVGNYEDRVLNYVHERYGHYMTILAQAFSQRLAQKFLDDLNASAEKHTDDMFERLEQEMREDRDGPA